MKILGFFAALMLAVAAYGQGAGFENGGGGGTAHIQLPTYAQGSQAVWNLPPTILGPTNGTEGDTLTFSNAMFSAWTGSGIVETNYCTFTNYLSNGTVSQQVQTVTLNNGRATGSKSVLVSPLPVSANFSITPLLGPPPLATVVSNLTVGVYTNAVWTFANASSTNTLTTNAATFAWTFGASTNDFSTNTVSLTVAGYGTSILTKTNYVTASATPELFAMVSDGSQNYAATDPASIFCATNLYVSAWVWVDSYPGSQYGFLSAKNGAGDGWVMNMVSGGDVYFAIVVSGVPEYTPQNSGNIATNGQWNFIEGGYDLASNKVFCRVNGVWTGDAVVPATVIPASPVQFNIGLDALNNYFLPGQIRDVKVGAWDVSTTNTVPKWIQGATGATAYYPMTVTNGISVIDSISGTNANFIGVPPPFYTNAPSSFP